MPPDIAVERNIWLMHAERRCAQCVVSDAQPVDGCPIYTEYLKEGDDVPSRLCTLHRGSIRQRLTRTFQGWLAEAGRRVRATVK